MGIVSTKMGCAGPFFICGAGMLLAKNDLEQLLERTLSGLGYELVDFDLSNRNKMLQVFIDKQSDVSIPVSVAGITLADCERVSQQLQRVLPVEGVNYDRLEVSSPGLDRRLRKSADFVRFAGNKVEVKLRIPSNGRRRLVGVLGAVIGNQMEIDIEGARFVVKMATIDRVRLVPQI